MHHDQSIPYKNAIELLDVPPYLPGQLAIIYLLIYIPMCSRLFIPFARLAKKVTVQIMFQVAMPVALTVIHICAYVVPELNGAVPHGPHPNKRVFY